MDELSEALGRTIRLARIDQRLERRDLAERAGISYSYLSAIENGQKEPSGRVLYAIARSLGLRDDELLAAARDRLETNVGPTAPPAPPSAVAASTAPRAASAAPGPRRRAWLSRPAAVQEHRLATPAEPAPGPSRRPPDERGAELAELLSTMSDDDAIAVMDLARRLARRSGF